MKYKVIFLFMSFSACASFSQVPDIDSAIEYSFTEMYNSSTNYHKIEFIDECKTKPMVLRIFDFEKYYSNIDTNVEIYYQQSKQHPLIRIYQGMENKNTFNYHFMFQGIYYLSFEYNSCLMWIKVKANCGSSRHHEIFFNCAN